ncbi:hypothetical protein AB1I62_04010 [Enterococcus sp. AN402]|uniref:hypothetical protein n=1 Tax=Enterococcus sp. AN402 TaxID=3151386 RepID=UPI00345ADEC9
MSYLDNWEDLARKLAKDFSLNITNIRQGEIIPSHKAYDCVLSYNDKEFYLTFQSDPKFSGEPTIADIVSSMVEDASTWQNYRNDIDGFAANLMPEAPVSKVVSAFNKCKESAEWLGVDDGKPFYNDELFHLQEMLDEHFDDIKEKIQAICKEKSDHEAYMNPPVPEGFIPIKEVIGNFDVGDIGDQITGYSGSEDVFDAFSEIADANIDIYYYDLYKWFPDNVEYVQEASDQGLLEGVKGDISKMIQMGQYVAYTEDLYLHQDDICSYFTANQLYDSGIYMVSEDIADTLFDCGEDSATLDKGLYTINTEIRDTLICDFVAMYGDDELAEEMADMVIDEKFTKVNPCIMHITAAREVAEKGYDEAFRSEWNDYLKKVAECQKNSPLEHTLSSVVKELRESSKTLNNHNDKKIIEKSTDEQKL